MTEDRGKYGAPNGPVDPGRHVLTNMGEALARREERRRKEEADKRAGKMPLYAYGPEEMIDYQAIEDGTELLSGPFTFEPGGVLRPNKR